MDGGGGGQLLKYSMTSSCMGDTTAGSIAERFDSVIMDGGGGGGQWSAAERFDDVITDGGYDGAGSVAEWFHDVAMNGGGVRKGVVGWGGGLI